MAARLKGRQQPSYQLTPRHTDSYGPDAAALAEGYGMPPDPWQRLILDGWMGTLKDGRWAAGDCGVSVPRQNGKNGVIEFLELYDTAILGLKILHTAHEVKTCRKHFLRMKNYFENARQYPELAAAVDYIRNTNGQEAIVLTNGGSIEFIARSKSSGRGFTVDILVCDEAQELTDEQMEAIQPATSSAPSGNPQTIYAGTPTPPSSPGTVFERIRRTARTVKPKRTCWYEWGVEEIGDIHDPTRWAQANPSLGIRLVETVIESEVSKFTPEGFARERLDGGTNPNPTPPRSTPTTGPHARPTTHVRKAATASPSNSAPTEPPQASSPASARPRAATSNRTSNSSTCAACATASCGSPTSSNNDGAKPSASSSTAASEPPPSSRCSRTKASPAASSSPRPAAKSPTP